MRKIIATRKLSGGVSSLALLAVFATAPAYGQSAPSGDEIVVTGTRLQNQKASEEKRKAENIVDVITSDDVGSLPDFSVAEAVSRVTGVGFEGRNGDAEFVVVRGIRPDFNHLEIDGGIVPSTRSNGRATQLSIIPSYVIKKTAVVKSFSADLDGNSIGGQILVDTRSAFDQSKTYFAARGALGFFEQTDSPEDSDLSRRADAAFAKRFGSNEQFGIVLSGSYLLQDYDTYLPGVAFSEYAFRNPNSPNANQDVTRNLEDAGPGFVQSPHGVQQYLYNNEIERIGGFGKLEYSPNDSFYAALSAYKFKEDDTEQRWDDLLFANRFTSRPVDNLTETTGTVNFGRAYRQYFLQGDTNTIESLGFTSRWSPSEDHKVDLKLTTTAAERKNPFYQIRFDATTANERRFAFNYDISGEYPTLNILDSTAWNDSSLFRPIFYRPRFDINSQKGNQAKLDYSYKMDADAGFGVKAGFSYRSDERKQDQLFDHDYRPSSTAARAFTMDNAELAYRSTFQPNLIQGQQQIFIDQDAFLDFFNANIDGFSDRKNQDVEGLSSQYQVKEDITAAYLMARFKAENFKATAGLRYENTDLSSTGAQRLDDDDPNTPEYPIITETANYDYWLPSATAIWDVTANTRLRAAYSKSLGRGQYNELAVLGSRVVNLSTDPNDPGIPNTINISSGNPQLLPRVSDNFDLSVAHYFENLDGAFSVGVFHKDIANEIYRRNTTEDEVIDGLTYRVRTSQFENVNSAKITGFEAGFTLNSLDFVSPSLADIGFSGNYAHITSNFTIEDSDGVEREIYGLRRQPRNITNFTAFWTPGDFEFKAAYAWSDRNLESASASSPTFDEFIGPRKRMDLRARYKFDQSVIPGNFTLFAEGRNVTNEGTARELSYGRTKWSRDYGRSAWVGLIYKY